jgi:hypothetical protein
MREGQEQQLAIASDEVAQGADLRRRRAAPKEGQKESLRRQRASQGNGYSGSITQLPDTQVRFPVCYTQGLSKE